MHQTHKVDSGSQCVVTSQTQEGINAHHTSIVARGHGSMVIAPQISNSHIGGDVLIISPDSHNTAEDWGAVRVSAVLKSNLKRRFENIFEGMAKRGNPTLLNRIFTEVYITEEEERDVFTDLSKISMWPKRKMFRAHTSDKNLNEHELWQLDTASRDQTCQGSAINCNDIFKPLSDHNVYIRTVVTKGVAGIGKTVSVQKFILDWAEEKANQDVNFIFVLPFRELNRYQDDMLTLNELLKIFHPELKNMKNVDEYDDVKMVFIFDGLDESQLPLRFKGNKFIADVTQRSSLDALMTNLFRGRLLPSAHIWITSRPAAVHRISSNCIQRVTEIRGFNDHQKEEYFKNRLSEKQSDTIISHIRASRSLHAMCHIPVFCWILSTLLGGTLSGTITENIPYTLTGMYTRFLLIQLNMKNQKYNTKDERDSRGLSSSDIQVLLQMGKLAFENLERSNLLFSEKDLERYSLNTVEISVHSGLFTEILKKEDPMFEEQWYSFVHLSIQEFLAALYMFLSFVQGRTEVPLLKSMKANASHKLPSFDKSWLTDSVQYGQKHGNSQLSHEEYLSYVLDDSDCDSEDEYRRPELGSDVQSQQQQQDTPQDFSSLHEWHRVAVDKALKSKNGNLDLFLQFFLGLSVEANYSLLKCLSLPSGIFQVDVLKTTKYIQHKLGMEDQRRCPTPERCINLLHCLIEMGDTTVLGEIQSYLTSRTIQEMKLTAAQCSALAYIMLTSKNISDEFKIVFDEFDLKSIRTSAGGRRRLVPLIRCCRKAIFANCQLTRKCFETISSALQSAGSPLRDLDLSHNFLVPETLETLCAGLSSPHCHLDSLDLSYINLEQSGTIILQAALLGSHHQPSCLRLSGCYLRNDCSEILLTALQSEKSRLTLLDLSNNRITDGGVSQILTGLRSPNCKLQTLRLGGCAITMESCKILSSVLELSSLRELDLSGSGLGDVGVKQIFSRTLNQLETLRLRECGLSTTACGVLGEALSSSVLKELELQDNDLRDSGVKLLCVGLEKPTCILQSAGLSGCLVTEEGCIYLASALKSNPSHLQVLDLSYNHPGESGERRLSEALEDPNYRLETLNIKDGGLHRIKPLLGKYACDLTLDPNTKDPYAWMHLSEDMKTAYMQFPENMVRLQAASYRSWFGVTCSDGLTGGRFYWEVEWTEKVVIGVKYKGKDSRYHKESWSLYCDTWDGHYEVSHNNSFFRISMDDAVPRIHRFYRTDFNMLSKQRRRVGVYLDWPAGTLSFYSITSDRLTHLHTFHSSFTQPLYPEFYLYDNWHPSVRIITL